MTAPSPFAFWAELNVRFGAGVFRELPRHLAERGFRRPAAIVDAAVVDQPACAEVLDHVRRASESWEIYSNAVSEPDYDYLDQVTQRARQGDADCVIAVGGGSTLDLAKAVSVLLTNPGRGLEYRGFNLVRHPGIPLVAAPTTAGTGSEATPNAVFIDRAERRKFGINTPLYMPKVSLLDPALTLSCPRAVTVSAGMDALVHSVESYVARAATPTSRMYSREAFRLVFNHLARVVAEPASLPDRAAMLLGAHYAGIALMNSGAGPAGAMSYPLGVEFGVPHGLAGAVFLAPVVEYNLRGGADVYADLYDLIDGAEGALGRAEKARLFGERLRGLCRSIGVPESLRAFGVSAGDTAALARQTMLLASAVNQNPVAAAEEDIASLFGCLV